MVAAKGSLKIVVEPGQTYLVRPGETAQSKLLRKFVMTSQLEQNYRIKQGKGKEDFEVTAKPEVYTDDPEAPASESSEDDEWEFVYEDEETDQKKMWAHFTNTHDSKDVHLFAANPATQKQIYYAKIQPSGKIRVEVQKG